MKEIAAYFFIALAAVALNYAACRGLQSMETKKNLEVFQAGMAQGFINASKLYATGELVEGFANMTSPSTTGAAVRDFCSQYREIGTEQACMEFYYEDMNITE